MRYLTHNDKAVVTTDGPLMVIPGSVERYTDTEDGTEYWTASLPMENECFLVLYLEDSGRSWISLSHRDLDNNVRIRDGVIQLKYGPGIPLHENLFEWGWNQDVIGVDDVKSALRQIGRMGVVCV